MCKKIHRGGNAEQYHADKKYKEAVAVAVEACAEDVKGQTCYICTQALHWKTKEGLVRGCACRGTAGFVHVSCLAEQAKILIEEADEKNMDREVKAKLWTRWQNCRLCGQCYNAEVACALGWACWKTYLGPGNQGLMPRVFLEKILGEDAENARRVLGPTKDIVIDMQRDLSMLRKLIAHLRAARETP